MSDDQNIAKLKNLIGDFSNPSWKRPNSKKYRKHARDIAFVNKINALESLKLTSEEASYVLYYVLAFNSYHPYEIPVVKFYLSLGINFKVLQSLDDAPDRYTPLIYVRGASLLQNFINAGANPNFLPEYISFQKGNPELIQCVTLLINAGANVNKGNPSKYGETAVFSCGNLPDVFQLLVAHGADVKIRPMLSKNLATSDLSATWFNDLIYAIQQKGIENFDVKTRLVSLNKLKDLGAIDVPTLMEHFQEKLKSLSPDNLQYIQTLSKISGGKKHTHLYNGKKYTIRSGPRGGRYILVKGEKKRIK